MTDRYEILHQGRRIGLAYVSPHPDLEGHFVVSIIPLERKGTWEDDTLEIHLERPHYDIFSNSIDATTAINDVLSQAAIEDWQVQVRTVQHF